VEDNLKEYEINADLGSDDEPDDLALMKNEFEENIAFVLLYLLYSTIL
jgi:hypothetical protein